MYDEIKKNIIEHFMNPNYLWGCFTTKDFIVKDAEKRIPFNIRYPNFSDYEKIEMNLGDNVSIVFNLKWEVSKYENSFGRDIVKYRLISID